MNRLAFALLIVVSAAAHGQKISVAVGTAPPDLTLQTYWLAEGNGFYQAVGVEVQLASRTAKYDYLHEIGDAARDLPDFIYTVEVASEKSLREKRAALQAFANGTLRGARWAMQNPEAAIAISQKLLPDVAHDEIAAGL